MAGLIYSVSYRGWPVYIHFNSYYMIWNKGITPTSIVGYRFGVVRRKVGRDELPGNLEWIKKSGYDGRYKGMDYILVRGKIWDEHKKYMEGFRKVKEVDVWALYERVKVREEGEELSIDIQKRVRAHVSNAARQTPVDGE